MAAPQPDPNDVVFVLPPGVTFLGEALVPVVVSLKQDLAKKIRSSGPDFVVPDDLSTHMGTISSALGHLSSWLEIQIVSFMKDEKAGNADAYRLAGRLEQILSEFVDGYQLAQISRAGPETRQSRTLLLGVYWHHISEICDWLDELIQVIANPRVAMEKLGIPLTENMELPVVLRMTSPPEVAKLQKLADELLVEPAPEVEEQPSFQPQSHKSPGILGTIGALAFGFGITKHIFGRGSR